MKKDKLEVPVPISPDAVISFKDWFKMIGVSENTALALRRAGNAPRFFHISPKRIGTTLGEHREWLASREEVAAVPQVDTRKRRRVAGA
jgi:hypothetical protein